MNASLIYDVTITRGEKQHLITLTYEGCTRVYEIVRKNFSTCSILLDKRRIIGILPYGFLFCQVQIFMSLQRLQKLFSPRI